MANPTPEQVLEAVKELRGIIDSGKSATSEAKEKLDLINEVLDKQEEKNQQLTQEIAKREKAENELKDRLETIETKAFRIGNGGGNEEKDAEYKAFEKFIVSGKSGLSMDETKILRTDIDTDGGFLVHPEITDLLLKNITEISPIRQIARVRQTSSKSIVIHRRTGIIQGGWTGECEQITDTSSTYGDEEIFVNRLTVCNTITVEMLNDSSFNMETEIMMDVTEDFAQKEGEAFVTGDGVKKPEGFINDSNIQIVTTGIANDISADSIIEIAGELKTGYSPVYLLNRRTTAAVRQLKDGNGQYLWQPGLAGGLPNTLNGAPYLETPDLADIAADSKPIAYGDFGRGYTIVDSVMMSVIRDQFTLAQTGKVKFIFMRRVGGQVVLSEAIKILQVAV